MSGNLGKQADLKIYHAQAGLLRESFLLLCREVVERRAHIVTGRKPTEAEVDNMIDTGESETIFQKAILEQGRGHVSLL